MNRKKTEGLNILSTSIPSVPGFTGRSRELSTLKQFFPRQRIMVIQGIPGIGKTALAAEFARHIARDADFDQFSGGIIWVTCEEGWRFDSLLATVDNHLSEQGEPCLPSDGTLEDKLGHLIAVLENRPRVLFIDDFHLLDQSRALLMVKTFKNYLKTSKLVLITRCRLDMPALDRVDIFERRLEGLDPDETASLAENLLAAHAENIQKPDEDLMQKLYSCIQGHPFAVKIFISLLLEGNVAPSEILDTPEVLTGELGDAFLKRMIDTLPEKERDLLQALSLFRGPVQRNVFGAPGIPDCPEARRNLEDKFLLETRPSRLYSVPKIARDFLISQLPSSRLPELHGQCLQYYKGLQNPSVQDSIELIHHAMSIESWHEAADASADIASTMFDLGMLSEVITLAETLMQHVEIPPELKLARAQVLRVFGVHDKALEILKKLRDTANENLYAPVLVKTALHHLQLGQYDEALDLFADALTIYEEKNDSHGIGDVLHQLGVIHHHRGDIEMAEKLFRQALEIFEKSRDERKIAKSQNYIGVVMQKKGRYSEAEQLFLAAIEAEERYNNIGSLKGLYHNLANVYRERGLYDQALELYEKSLKCSKMTGNSTVAAGTELSRANIFRDRGDYEAAAELYNSALKTFEEHRHIRGIAFTLNNIGVMHLARERYPDALENLERAYKLFEETGDKIRIAGSMLMMGRLLIKTGDSFTANRLFRQGLDLAIQSGFKKEAVDLRLELAELAIQAGDIDKAEALAEECRPDCLELRLGEGLLQLLFVKYRVCNSKGKTAEAMKHLDKIRDELLLLPTDVRKRLEHIAEVALGHNIKGAYEVFEKGRHYKASKAEVDELRSRPEAYDLWLDVENRDLREKTRGPVNILKRRTVAPLLLFLIKNAGSTVESRDLFREVWQRPYDPESDGATLRVNISRLRKLIEPKGQNGCYIQAPEEGGGYLFTATANYCMIVPGKL